MNLQNIIRDQTRPILDLLTATKNEVDNYRRKQASADARERTSGQEAAELQPGIAEQEHELRSSQLKIQELEQQLEELRQRLVAQQVEYERADGALQERRREVSDKAREATRARKEAQGWASKADQAEERLRGYRLRLDEERLAALVKYLSELWTKLLDSERDAEGRATAVQALHRLERARHDDPGVAGLWEAHQEWRRISQSAVPPAVRRTALRELEAIEKELEEQFPGALKAASTGTLDELEELYFCHRERTGGYLLLLGVPEDVCEQLNSGQRGTAEELAARVVWAFAHAIPRTAGLSSTSRSRFGQLRGFLVLDVEQGEAALRGHDAVVLPLPGGGRVSFVLSELPQEVSGVMNNEHFDG